MEPYVLVIIPIVAAYLGWMTNRIVKLVEVQSATVATLGAVVVRQDHMEIRVDALVASKFSA